MKNNRAFTLIEVMVVLSILALIAILAYNFFGGTMKEASEKQAITKIFNDMRTLDDAYRLYQVKTGSTPSTRAVMVSSGVLKSEPNPDSNYITNYIWDYQDSNYSLPTTALDDAIWGSNIPAAICKSWNEKYCPGCTEGADANQYLSSLHAGAYPANVDISNNRACLQNAAGDATGTILWIIDAQ